MNFSELQDRLNFVLDNNDGQLNQSFSTARLKQAINLAYEQEVNKAQLNVSKNWFLAKTLITWVNGQVTLSLPETISKKQIVQFSDITSSNPGRILSFNESGFSGDLFWKDRKTLQWGTTGPSQETIVEITYYASADNLVNNDDYPELLPNQFHFLIVWSAAITLLEIADQSAPKAWYSNRDEMRLDLYKFMSIGRPTNDPPRIVPKDSDPNSGILI